MAIKLVKGGKAAAAPVTARGLPVSGRPLRPAPAERGSPLAWVIVALVAVVGVVTLAVAASRAQRSRQAQTGKWVLPANYGARAGDSLDASMGGKSMREWCAAQEKTNEMVKLRQKLRTGQRP